MPASILLAVAIMSFFIPQIAGVAAVAIVRNNIAAALLGVLVFMILACVHASLIYSVAHTHPTWWFGGNALMPVLYIPVAITAVIGFLVSIEILDRR